MRAFVWGLVLTVVVAVVSIVPDLVPLPVRVIIAAVAVVMGAGALRGFVLDQRAQLSEQAEREIAEARRFDALPRAVAAELLAKGLVTPAQSESVRESVQRAVTGVVNVAIPIGIKATGTVANSRAAVLTDQEGRAIDGQ